MNLRRPTEFSEVDSRMAFDMAYRDMRDSQNMIKAQTEAKRAEQSPQRNASVDSGMQRSVSPGSGARLRTKGQYRADSQMQSLIKHSADFQKGDKDKLLDRNEHLKKFMARKEQVENKKLISKRQQKVNMDKVVKENMTRSDRVFIK